MDSIRYLYDPQSGEFTVPVSCALSPARPMSGGKPNYLIPAHSTDQAPPDCAPGYAAVFDGAAWNVVQDKRGSACWDKLTGERRSVAGLGPLPEGVTDIPPPGPDTIWDGGWVLPEPSQEQARSKRNALLCASDYTQLADAPLCEADKAAWRSYRQALRDYMNPFAASAPWPTPPGRSE